MQLFLGVPKSEIASSSSVPAAVSMAVVGIVDHTRGMLLCPVVSSFAGTTDRDMVFTKIGYTN